MNGGRLATALVGSFVVGVFVAAVAATVAAVVYIGAFDDDLERSESYSKR